MSASGPTYYYYATRAQPVPPPRYTTSKTEIRDIGIAFAVLTFDLTIILGGASVLLGAPSYLFTPGILTVAVVAATVAVTGFLAHELAHKFVAQRNRSWAEFRMAPFGLVLSVVTAMAGFLFAAPGATVVGGMDDRDAWGRTAIAGPLTNIGFALLFFVAALGGAYAGLSPSIVLALLLLMFFNGWWGTFNLIPLGPLDGAKVLHWSSARWAGAIVLAGAITVFAYLAQSGLASGHPFGVP